MNYWAMMFILQLTKRAFDDSERIKECGKKTALNNICSLTL